MGKLKFMESDWWRCTVCHGLVLWQLDSRRFANVDGVDGWSKNDYMVLLNKVKGFISVERGEKEYNEMFNVM